MFSGFRIVIFGAGRSGLNLFDEVCADGGRVVAFIDNDEKKWGQPLKGVPVESPKILPELEFDKVAIGTSWWGEIQDQLLTAFGISPERTIIPAKRHLAGGVLADTSAREGVEAFVKLLLSWRSESNESLVPMYGTLLGLIRDGGLIPWDTDVDLGLPAVAIPEFQDWLEGLRQHSTDHKNLSWEVGFLPDGKIYGFFMVVQINEGLVPIDILVLHRTDQKVTLGADQLGRGTILEYPTDMFYPTSAFEWNGVTIRIPAKATKYLRVVYGAAWKSPNPNYTYADTVEQVSAPLEHTIIAQKPGSSGTALGKSA